jgi:hypothetical protein
MVLLERPKFRFLSWSDSHGSFRVEFRDLILMEVSELNGIPRFIVRSVCKQYSSCNCAFKIRTWCRLIHWLFNKDFDQQIQWIRDIHCVFTLLESKIKIYVGVNGDICVNLEFRNSLLELGCFAGSIVVPTILLFFRCFFWRSGLLECWIQSYVRGHCLAVLSGLGRRYTHPERWIHLPFRGHWPYRLRSNHGNCFRTNDWQLSIYPRRRIPAFIPHGIKASLCDLRRPGLYVRHMPCSTFMDLFGTSMTDPKSNDRQWLLW